jgi:hypothetical protein
MEGIKFSAPKIQTKRNKRFYYYKAISLQIIGYSSEE